MIKIVDVLDHFTYFVNDYLAYLDVLDHFAACVNDFALVILRQAERSDLFVCPAIHFILNAYTTYLNKLLVIPQEAATNALRSCC
jgi:hypothetical protein